MKHKLAYLSIVALVIFGVACGSMNRMTPAGMDESTIKADVKGKIAALYPSKTFDIGVTVNGTVVTLSGKVEDMNQVRAIGEAANSVNGVKRVINNIQVK